jgi:hypothetical protein
LDSRAPARDDPPGEGQKGVAKKGQARAMRASRRPLALSGVLLCASALGLAVVRSTGPAIPAAEAAEQTFTPPAVRLVPKPPARFVFVGGGDIALAGPVNAHTLSGLARFVRPADLAVANLEGTLATGGYAKCKSGPASGCFSFRASPGWAAMLRRVGFDDMNVANNHALDYGLVAQQETIGALQEAKLAFDGLPGQVTYLDVKGVKVAVIGFAPYRWAQQLLDVGAGRAIVRRAARHADVVLVYMHAGAEGAHQMHVGLRDEMFLGERRGNPLLFAHAMVDAGADLVFASGPHVVRGLQWYHGHLIAYSLGNLAGIDTLSTGGVLGESALLRVTIDAAGRFVRGSLIPLRLDAKGTPAYDPARRSIGLMRALSRDDFGRTAMTISAAGKLAAPEPSGSLAAR